MLRRCRGSRLSRLSRLEVRGCRGSLGVGIAEKSGIKVSRAALPIPRTCCSNTLPLTYCSMLIKLLLSGGVEQSFLASGAAAAGWLGSSVSTLSSVTSRLSLADVAEAISVSDHSSYGRRSGWQSRTSEFIRAWCVRCEKGQLSSLIKQTGQGPLPRTPPCSVPLCTSVSCVGTHKKHTHEKQNKSRKPSK